MAKQITQEQIDKIIDRLNERVYKANDEILKVIGKSIDEIGKLTPTKAHQLGQMLKYGGNYDKIIKQLNKYTDIDIKEIDKIFETYAKNDRMFYEQFYKYRNIPFTKYEDNVFVKTQTESLANVIKNQMYNFTRDNVLGYSITDELGRLRFTGIRDVYNQVIETALMNVGQGKETFNNAMTGILREIGQSGLKTIQYASGRSIRLDSAIRMHIKDGLAQVHNENQKIYGREFNADGYEISVHLNPAPDHEEVQGRQFSIAEYDILNSGGIAKDYKGNSYTLDHDAKNGYRPISTMNCYHYIFPIVLGVSKPEYSDEQLNQIREDNDKGFEIDGKHYTNYEGTQLQRALERKIREQKDIQILAKESNNTELIQESQKNITKLTNKYKEVSDVSGLSTRMERMRVSGYKRIAQPTNTIIKPKQIEYNVWEGDTIYLSSERTSLYKKGLEIKIANKNKEIKELKNLLDERGIDINDSSRNASIYRISVNQLNEYKKELESLQEVGNKKLTLNSLEDCKELLGYNNIKMKADTFEDLDFKLIKEETKNIYDLSNKYPAIRDEILDQGIVFRAEKLVGEEADTIAKTGKYEMILNKDLYKDYNKMVDMNYNDVLSGYHMFTPKQNLDKLITTHEFGHLTSFKLKSMYTDKTSNYILQNEWNKTILDDFMEYASKKLDRSKDNIAMFDISEYGKTDEAEAFAELFLSANNGGNEKIGDIFEEWLGEKINEYSK